MPHRSREVTRSQNNHKQRKIRKWPLVALRRHSSENRCSMLLCTFVRDTRTISQVRTNSYVQQPDEHHLYQQIKLKMSKQGTTRQPKSKPKAQKESLTTRCIQSVSVKLCLILEKIKYCLKWPLFRSLVSQSLSSSVSTSIPIQNTKTV